MPRWLRLIRGMIGTGLAFAVGGAAIVGTIGLGFWMFGDASLFGVAGVAARSAVLSFGIGVVFSGALALLARGRSFEKLSVKAFAALGGAVGLAAWTAMGLNGAFSAWSLDTALVNLALLTGIGAGSAAATLLVARRARSAHRTGKVTERLDAVYGAEAGRADDTARSAAKQTVRRADW